MAEQMKGSFGASGSDIERMIRDSRAAEKVDTAIKDAAKERADDRVKKREAEIDSKLPKTVLSNALGDTIPYAEFKRLYAEVWQQIEDKDHLLTNRVEYRGRIGSIPVVIQSLKRREEKALTFYEPSPVGYMRPNPMAGVADEPARIEVTPQIRAEQQVEFMTRRMVVQLVRLGDATFADVALTPETRDKWAADEHVKQSIDYLYDIDPTLFEHLVGLVTDLDKAKYFALVENMKNPLAVSSPTTDSES